MTGTKMWCIMAAVAAALALAPTARAGEELALSLHTEVDTVYSGEPLLINVRVTNVSQQPVVVPIFWERGCFTMRCTYGTDKPREWNPFVSPKDSFDDRTVTLQPGESYQTRTGLLLVTRSGGPGRYTLQALLESDGKARKFEKDTGKYAVHPCWAGKVESRPLVIEIKALTEAQDEAALGVLLAGREYLRTMWRRNRDSIVSGQEKRYATVVEKYPKSVFARHCELTIARAYAWRFRGGGAYFQEAVEHYTNVIKNYAPFHLTDDAMLELARIYLKWDEYYPGKGFRDKALALLQDVVKNYAKSDSVEAATRLLESLKAGKAPDKKETDVTAELQEKIAKYIEDFAHDDTFVKTDGEPESLTTLAHWGIRKIGEAAIPQLIAATTHANPEVRVHALAEMGYMNTGLRGVPYLPVFARSVRDKDPHVRGAAFAQVGHVALALRDSGSNERLEEAVGYLVRGLKDEYVGARCIAGEFLFRAGREDLVPEEIIRESGVRTEE